MKETVKSLGYLCRSLLPYLKPYKWGLLWGAAALLLSNVGLVAVSWAIGKVASNAATAALVGKDLYLSIIGVTVLLLFSAWMKYSMRMSFISISRYAERDLRNNLFRHMQTLSPSFYDRERVGEMMSRSTNDINAVRDVLGPGVMYPVNLISIGPAAFGVMFYLSWELSLSVIAPMFLLPILVIFFTGKMHGHFSAVQRLLGEMSSKAREIFTGIRVLKTFVREKHEEEGFGELGRQYIEQSGRLYTIRNIFFPILHSFGLILSLVAFAAGGYGVRRGWLDIGDFASFVLVQGHVMVPIIMVSWVMGIYERGGIGMKRLNSYFETEPEIVDSESVDSNLTPSRELEVRHLDFSYSKEGPKILSDINIRIQSGEIVGITGPTGCGKSSLLRVLVRQYPYEKNHVFYDGEPIEKIPLRNLRESIGYVEQEPFIFSATLEDNIRFGAEDISEDEMYHYTGIAGLASDIEEFDKGYNTMVGERGVTLSGGQKLRLALSRALSRRSPFLFLDDSFSAVDVQTEDHIMENLKRNNASRGCCLLVSHRVSTLRRCDRIYVMEDGKITQTGTHDELYEAKGFYRRLVKEQELIEEMAGGKS